MSLADAPTLISEEYRRMQEDLHRNPDYGVASVGYAPLVAEICLLSVVIIVVIVLGIIGVYRRSSAADLVLSDLY